uniref:Uncharacterized protein n=1 Tax=Branchiostoma floridae TaxID=7739 RepID=C3ZFV2_BRAFL|eukprot:XP_002592579.1 hypothetical protein BRAFLDRAFT_68901 [Branchiostoma floridae]
MEIRECGDRHHPSQLYFVVLHAQVYHLPAGQCVALEGRHVSTAGRAESLVCGKSRIGNKKLYNGLPPISRTIQKRRLALAGHVARHEEMAAKVLLWELDAKRKRGRPNLILKKVLEEEVGLKGYNLLAAMLDRNAWLNIVNGTSYEEDDLN